PAHPRARPVGCRARHRRRRPRALDRAPPRRRRRAPLHDRLRPRPARAPLPRVGQLFDEAERAALALTDEMTRNVKVSDATMKRIRKALPDDQVIELIGTIAGYNMVSRFVVATGVEVEKP